jgi:phospholipase/lecithinase/hemolysin
MFVNPNSRVTADSLVAERGELKAGYYVFNDNMHPYSGPHSFIGAYFQRFLMSAIRPNATFQVEYWIP